MPTALRTGVPTGTITWSDGTPFDGTVGIGLKHLIDGSSANWPSISLGNAANRRPVPRWTIIAINEGQFDPNASVWYNADLTPPNSQYVARYADANGKLVSNLTSAFTVSTSTFTIPSVILTLPTVGSDPTND
jgi:hypothetical protein